MKSSAWYGELSVEAVEARFCPERGESPNVFYSACHSILASRLGRPIILHLRINLCAHQVAILGLSDLEGQPFRAVCKTWLKLRFVLIIALKMFN